VGNYSGSDILGDFFLRQSRKDRTLLTKDSGQNISHRFTCVVDALLKPDEFRLD
jgi:hypothetical protein